MSLVGIYPGRASINTDDVYEPNAPGSSQSPVLLERWEDRHVRLLIASYTEYKHLFAKGKTTKKDIFVKIANAFNSKSDKMVTGDQCLRKWAKLELKTN